MVPGVALLYFSFIWISYDTQYDRQINVFLKIENSSYIQVFEIKYIKYRHFAQ